jgi:heat-inducible transcriptional repressor
MLDERKAKILKAVVEEYVQTAQPVGSGHVARAPGMQVSPATVRNDMAALETEGFLHQPHTSAGRVPTDKGYRYFVDHLGGPGRLGAPQAQQVRSFFNEAHGELEQMLADTSRLLARLTDSAAVVVAPSHDASAGVVRSAQLVGLGSRHVLLVVVLGNGHVEKLNLELDAEHEVGDAQVAAATTRLGAHGVGRSFAELGDVPATGEAGVDHVLERARAAVVQASGHADDVVFLDGASRMAASFDAIETVTNVLRILEQQYVVVTLLRDVLDRGLHVAIGSETGMLPLAECAVVVAPYEIDGEPAGSIGVLGPMRMDYPQALAAVTVVSDRLGHRLSEG